MGYTKDLLPHIGAVPGRNNQFIMAGYNGGGMLHIFLAGKTMAKMIGEDAEYAGIPQIFRTTQERLDSDVDKLGVFVESRK